MNRAAHSPEAAAEAAFSRYAAAAAQLQRTGRPGDALAARRAWRRFAEAYLTPAELAEIDHTDIPALRGQA